MNYLRPVDLRRFGAVIALCSFSLPVLGFTQEASAKEVCVRATSGEVVCGTLVAKPVDRPLPKPATNAGQGATVEKDGLRFQAAGCTRSRQEEGIICGLLVTNLGDSEIKAFFYAKYSPSEGEASRAIETNGTTSYANIVYVGSNDNSSYITVSLDPSIPTKVNFKFKDVPKDASSLSALAAGYAPSINGDRGRVNTAIVRNIVIK